MTLPTFLVIGAMKAGTTSLWTYLQAQPGIFMAEEKELDFFVAEKEWRRGVSWYEAQFAAAPPSAVALGEGSTNYSKHPLFAGVPQRAVSVLPDVRLVYLLRNPVDRMRSHWLHARSAGWEARSFTRAVARDPQYVDISRYGMQLERWLEHVPRERVLIETSERLRNDPVAVLTAILRFLGVDHPVAEPSTTKVHTADELAPPRRAAARTLRSIPGARRLAGVVPEPIRRVYGRATTAELDASAATLSATQEAEVLELFRQDLRHLRALVGEPFDAWGLA
jgi:hypothetical protein